MTDESEWGPWVNHDGADCPVKWTCQVEIDFYVADEGALLPPTRKITPSLPNWLWRWRTVRLGWFRTERRRVCDDPVYAPIIRYRVRKPPALRKLIEMVENLPAPQKQPERVDG